MINDQDEQVIDETDWIKEAQAVINDVKDTVKEIIISTEIPSSNCGIYCNLTILEQKRFCIELTASGFRVVGLNYDDKSSPSDQYFETPYSLLDNLSPAYRESFSTLLATKLLKLQQNSDK